MIRLIVHDFILFDVKIGDWWLLREDVEDIAQKLGIKVVPIIGLGPLENAIKYVTLDPMSEIAAEEHLMEGLVLRPAVELRIRRGDRLITKIKVRDFKNL